MSLSLARRVALAVCALTLAGCTGGSKAASDPVETPTMGDSATTSSATPSSSPSPSAAAQLDLPPAEQGLTTLLMAGPKSGSAIVGSVNANQGELWLSLNCQGGDSLVVKFEPLDKFTFKCGQEIFVSKNQINLLAERQMKIIVEASADVKWAIRIEQ